MATTDGAPAGFVYREDVLTSEEERGLVERLQALPLETIVMRGRAARRRTAHFGWRYGYETWRVEPGPPTPSFLAPLRERAAALGGVAPAALEEILITEYPPGAGIGWHRDAPAFGVVVGVSLLAPCRMRFRQRAGPGWRSLAVPLAPRSAYVLAGPARTSWQHGIPAIPALRYSITFRTLRTARAGVRSGDRRPAPRRPAGSTTGPARAGSRPGSIVTKRTRQNSTRRRTPARSPARKTRSRKPARPPESTPPPAEVLPAVEPPAIVEALDDLPLATPEVTFAGRVPAAEPERPLPATRRAIFLDVENSSRAEHISRVIDHLAIDRMGRRTEFVAVGNWRVIGTDTARLLARHGAQLVHSAPATGVRDWSDLRIAVASGAWLAAARPGDVIEIVSDDRAFDAVGDVAATLGIAFRRLSYRGLLGQREAEPAPREREEPRRSQAGAGRGRRRWRGRRPAAAAPVAPAPVAPATIAPAAVAAAVDGGEPSDEAHTAPHDEIINVVRDLMRGAPGRGVTLDALANALKSRGFRRTPGSPRLITRLRRIKELEVSRAGIVTLVGAPPPEVGAPSPTVVEPSPPAVERPPSAVQPTEAEEPPEPGNERVPEIDEVEDETGPGNEVEDDAPGPGNERVPDRGRPPAPAHAEPRRRRRRRGGRRHRSGSPSPAPARL